MSVINTDTKEQNLQKTAINTGIAAVIIFLLESLLVGAPMVSVLIAIYICWSLFSIATVH